MLVRLARQLLDRLEARDESRSEAPRSKYGGRRLWSAFAVLALLAMTGSIMPGGATSAAVGVPAAVVPTLASSTQFDITGFLQSATLDTAGDQHSGGTLMVNGHTVVVPRETVVILPANALTWQELFTHAPAPYAPTQTGMALNDKPNPLTTYEVQVVGNRVIGGGLDRYIAGLVHVTQQGLNSGAGYINFMNYATGEMEVGGKLGVAGTGTRVQINDPANATALDQNAVAGSGRYGRAMTPDDRFQVDQDNPTIIAATGFPMCFPRTDPTVTDDPQCPQANRPVVSSPVADQSGLTPQPNALVAGQYYSLFRMDSPANVDAKPLPTCLRSPCADPRQQAPMEVGDYVNFAGTLIQDAGGNGGQYISAHTITDNTGIYTQPGIDPAYVMIEVSLLGTGGLTIFGAGEAAVRTRFEGMTTDESRQVHLYGIDINPLTGVTSDRDWGTILPDLGPPTGAVRGRWRFRPPCTATVATTKSCTPPPGGLFIPPTREVRAVIEGHQQFLPGTITANPASQVPGTPTATTAANGIFWSQYHAPIGEYIFPENVPGTAVPENNFNTIPFLAYGGYQSITGVQAGTLNPWPSSVLAPGIVCAAATINGAPYSVANGATIPLSGSVTAGASAPVTLQWTAGTTAGATDLNTALTAATTTTPKFNATGLAAGTYYLSFTASNACGVSTANTTTITVEPSPLPIMNPIQPQTVTAGNLVTIVASSNSLPTPHFSWAQTSGPAVVLNEAAVVPAVAPNTAASRVTFTPTVAGTYTFNVMVMNANGDPPAVSVTVVVTPAVPTNITLTNEYRIAKQRLIITAISTDPTVTSMVLQPYVTQTGSTFNPATLGAANLTVSLIAPGTFTLTAVGAPSPVCNVGQTTYATPCAAKPFTVKSVNAAGAIIGTSPPTALTTIRQ